MHSECVDDAPSFLIYRAKCNVCSELLCIKNMSLCDALHTFLLTFCCDHFHFIHVMSVFVM